MNRLKKVLVLFFVALISFSYGFASSRYELFPYNVIKQLRLGYLHRLIPQRQSMKGQPPGEWREARSTETREELSDDQKKSLFDLAAVPYLEGYHPATEGKGVVLYDEGLAQDALNFFVSAHAPKAFLMDMRGRILHEWGTSYKDIWQGQLPFYVVERNLAWWRRAHLFENGDVLAIFSGLGVVKLDKASNLIWSYTGKVHHDLFVDENGRIYTLAYEKRTSCDALELEGPILEDFITIISPEGKEIKRISILEAFLNSDYASLLIFMERKGDPFHTNTVHVFGDEHAEKIPMFKEGHILISMSHLHSIAIIDPETEKVTWALSGMWLHQHEPSVCPNGNLLIFDNEGHRGRSKVIEFNPLTQEVVWAYRGDAVNDFYSSSNGFCQRLSNGNTLITESNYGRVFEVTPDNRIVWEFLNPNRAGKDNELIATITQSIRIDFDQVSFLDAVR